MIIAGIDFSYTSPSICIYNTDDVLEFKNFKLFNFYFNTKKKGYLEGDYENINIQLMPEWTCQEERFANIRDWAVDILDEHEVEEVVLEGYAMGAKGAVFDIAENTALLKHWLWANRIPIHKPSPPSVKKTFTGKGNAKKPEMIEEFERRFNVKLFEILGVADNREKPVKPIDDLVDSVANMLSHPYFNKE